jgi:hypothetical protein
MEEKDFDTEFRVRLPSALAERIAKTADKEYRSRNSQYVYILENWFEIKDGLEDRVKRLEDLASEVIKKGTGQAQKKATG